MVNVCFLYENMLPSIVAVASVVVVAQQAKGVCVVVAIGFGIPFLSC